MKQELDERIKGRKGYGLIGVIHGNGKGKTTSALGSAIRCAGAGKKVGIIFFDKGGSDHYSERAILDQIDNIDYWPIGRDRINKETGRFDFSINDLDKSEGLRGLELARGLLLNKKYNLVILDELNSTMDLEILELAKVLEIIDNKLDDVELLITGRNPHAEILKRAHLISEVKLERHYFYSGVPTREGIDY